MDQETKKNNHEGKWVLISALAFIVFLLAALLLSFYNDQIASISRSAYFFLLIPLALICAAFLFGALRSKAKYSTEKFSGKLELSGPVVVLVIILFVGYKFAPAPTEKKALSVVVNVFSADSTNALDSGTVDLYFATAHFTKKIRDGQVVFNEIPSYYTGEYGKLVVKSYGYVSRQDSVILTTENIAKNVYLFQNPLQVRILGVVKDRKGNAVKDITLVFADDEKLKTTSDRYGTFNITLPYKEGQEISLKAYRNDEIKYDNLIKLSDKVPLTVALR